MTIRQPLSVQSINARIALVGAGTIGARYVESLRQNPGFEVLSVCSKNGENAARFAKANNLAASTLEDILCDPNINYVLNLTPAEEHGQTTRACLLAGKSVFSEKPLAAALDEADSLIELAEAKGLLLACAPATFLWPPLMTARRLITDGVLGSITGALTTLVYPGPELFHPNPAHLYSASAGPLRDMGVYQITVLMALLGPIIEVYAMASSSRTERSVLVGPDVGHIFPVSAPTNVHAQFLHSQGSVSSLIVSFDGMSASPSQIDVFGQAGGLSLSNAHAHDAVLTHRGPDCSGVINHDEPWSMSRWAIGPAGAWNAYCTGQLAETNARRARSVLEVMLAVEVAAKSRRSVIIPLTDDWSTLF